jgi:hypothetical protein
MAYPPQPVPIGPSTQAKVGSAQALDDQLVAWCLEQPDTTDQRCRCWPVALRAEGLADADLQDLLIRLGVVKGQPRTPPRSNAYENATANCGLMRPLTPPEQAAL